MPINNYSCVMPEIGRKTADAVVDTLLKDEDKKKDLSLDNSGIQEDARVALTYIAQEWGGDISDMEEHKKRLNDPDYFIQHLEEDIMTKVVSEADFQKAEEKYDEYLNKIIPLFEKPEQFGAKIGRIGLFEFSRGQESILSGVKSILAAYRDLLYIREKKTKDGGKQLIVIARKPRSVSPMEAAINRFNELQEGSKGFDYLENWIGQEVRDTETGEIRLIEKGISAPKKSTEVKTGRNLYSFHGRKFIALSVTSKVTPPGMNEEYPILAAILGSYVDAVGRMFFDKTSKLYEKDGKRTFHEHVLQDIIDNELGGIFTVEGLNILLDDFAELERQFANKWGNGDVKNIRVISTESILFGKNGEKAYGLDFYTTGKPDLIVFDHRGIGHVVDMKTKKMRNTTKGYNVVFDPTNTYDMEDKRKYQEQDSDYIAILRSYGLHMDEQPYTVMIDTWYDSSDFGEEVNKRKNEKAENGKKYNTVYDTTPSGRPVIRGGVENNPSTGQITLGEYSKQTGYTRKSVVGSEASQNILYIEPRLHSSFIEGKGMQNVPNAIQGEGVLEKKDVSYEAQFEALETWEQEAIEEMDGTPIKQRELAGGVKMLGITNIFSNPRLMDPIEVQSVAEWFMYEVQDVISNISRNPEGAAERYDYIHVKYRRNSLRGKSHDEIIRILGINNIIDVVFKNKFTKKISENFPILSEEDYIENAGSLDGKYYDKETKYKFRNWADYQRKKLWNSKFEWIHSHKAQFIQLGAAKLSALENVQPQKRVKPRDKFEDEGPELSLPSDNTDVRIDAGDNAELERIAEKWSDGLSDLEAWMMGQRNYSPRASLSKEIKKLFENLYLTDEKGKIQIDHYGWGFKMHLDATTAVQTINDIVKDCETIEEMENAMRKFAIENHNRWIEDILDAINVKKNGGDENIRAKFFRHFRKDALIYSACKAIVNEKGEVVIITQIINQKTVLETIRQSLGAEFVEGKVGKFTVDGKTHSLLSTDQYGRLVFTRIEDNPRARTVASFLNEERKKLLDEIDAIYDASDYYAHDDKGDFLIDEYGRREKATGNEKDEQIIERLLKTNILSRVTAVLHGIGIMVPEEVVKDTYLAKTHGKANNLCELLVMTGQLMDLFTQMREAGGIPRTLKNNKSYIKYAPMLEMLADRIQEHVESSTYYDNKTWYSYTNPSRLGHIVRNLGDRLDTFGKKGGKFEKYMYDNFGRYTGWFKDVKGEKWMNDWLNQFNDTGRVGIKARKAFKHKVELSYIGNQYRDLGALGFQLSVLHNYFGSKQDEIENSDYRWFALPTMSNKPTNEFVRMVKYYDYNEIIDKVLMNTFKQECNRIADVLYHYVNHITAVDEMDITDKKLNSIGFEDGDIKALKDRINNHSITRSDLIALMGITSGAKFHFLWYMNTEILKNDELGNKIVNMINGLLTKDNQSYDASTLQDVRKAIAANMGIDMNDENFENTIVGQELKRMEEIGMFDVVEEKDAYGNKVKVLKHQKEFGGKLGAGTGTLEQNKEAMREALFDYIWQDIAANINIIQLTGGDLAYYGNSVNYQKRIAQIHSPGLHLLSNEKYDDGYLRSVHISDLELKAEIKYHTEHALEQYLENNMGSASDAEKEEYRMMIKIISSMADKFNATDGQSFSSPTSMRKKLRGMGEWDDAREEAYRKICDGDFSIENLGILIQPTKPFVTSDLAKFSGSPTMELRRVPLQDKNSEYLIVLAAALAVGSDKNNQKKSKLAAIFHFMEKTAELHDKQGIDTVHFHSVGKVGASGIIDINEFDKNFDGTDAEYNEALMNYLLSKVERNIGEVDKNDEKAVRNKKYLDQEDLQLDNNQLKPEERVYNTQYVDTIPFDDYIIQQEVPAHLLDHEQLYGSQIRILGISDITPGTKFQVKGEENLMDDDVLVSEYKRLHAENIRESFSELMQRMGLKEILNEDGKVSKEKLKTLKRNPQELSKVYRKISDLLQWELSKDGKYGGDERMACSLISNSEGIQEFLIPLFDPIQSKRIQMLMNSIIKKKINKQRIKGGSVVQVTAYDNDLHIRFKDDKGNLLEKTLADFDNNEKAFKQYLRDNNASVAYYECYMSVPNEMLEYLIKDDGTMMSYEEAEKMFTEGGDENMKSLWEDLTRVIGYRIPTEDKYSMVPLKIIGFTPKAAGEVVMMPREITLLTGSDFDIDKMYIMRKSFNPKTLRGLDEKQMQKYSEDTVEEYIQWFQEELRKRDGKSHEIEFSAVVDGCCKQVIKNAEEKMSGNPATNWLSKINLNNLSEKEQVIVKNFAKWYRKKIIDRTFQTRFDRDKRNNRILDLQWAVLTNADTMCKLFNPGNFNEQKRVGRFIRIIKSKAINRDNPENEHPYTWKELSDMFKDALNPEKKGNLKKALNQLDDLLSNQDPHSVTLPSNKIYFQRQNMQGSQMVGLFANNLVSHAFMTFQRVGIDLCKNGKNKSFYFCGHRIGDKNDLLNPDSATILDRQKGFNGQLISKTIASFLAASVDTAKDPVLNDMGINTFTGNIAMVLARLGFDTESIGLFLSQPIIMELSDLYFKNKTDGYYSGENAIKQLAKDLGMKKEDLNTEGINDSSTLTKENLIAHLADDKYKDDSSPAGQLEFQKRVLKAFNMLFIISKDVQKLTFCTKFNSVSNAVGPTIADTMEDLDRVNDYMDDIEKSVFYVPTEGDMTSCTNPKEVISNDEMLEAFFETTLGKNGASSIIFGLMFPHYWSGFQNVVKYFKKNYLRGNKVTGKLYNQLLDSWLYYLMTYDDSKGEQYYPTIPYSELDKQYLVLNMPAMFEKVKAIAKEKGIHNELLDDTVGGNTLFVRKPDEYISIPILQFNSGQLDVQAQDKIKIAWTNLITMNDPKLEDKENASMRRFGVDLFFYSLMRNGFGFSPKTLMHLASVVTRMNAQFDSRFNEYLVGLKRLEEVDDILGGDYFGETGATEDTEGNVIEGYIRRFCDQFIRNKSNNKMYVPNIKGNDSRISYEYDEETGVVDNLQIVVNETDQNSLYDIEMSKGVPSRFITITTKNKKNRLVRTLCKLKTLNGMDGITPQNGQIKLEYEMVERLGFSNNFIEYDANSSLQYSFFSGMESDEGNLEDDDDSSYDSRKADPTDNVHDDADAERMLRMEFNNLTGIQNAAKKSKEATSKIVEYQKLLMEAMEISNSGTDLAKAFNTLLERGSLESKQKAMDAINEGVVNVKDRNIGKRAKKLQEEIKDIFEEQNKCNSNG